MVCLPAGQALGQVPTKNHNFDYEINVIRAPSSLPKCGGCVVDFVGKVCHKQDLLLAWIDLKSKWWIV